MAKQFFSAYPPYSGREPYLYLCFRDGDPKRIKPLLKQLYARHCRVWYSLGQVKSTARSRECAERIKNAALMVICLAHDCADDEGMKNALGSYLRTGKPVISFESGTLPADAGLPMLFTTQVKRISTDGLPPEALALTLMRAEGFTQELIGTGTDDFFQHTQTQKQRRQKRAALIVLAAAVLAAGSTFYYGQSHNWFRPVAAVQDTVSLSDPVIEDAARVALSPERNVPLGEEALATITALHLDGIPGSFQDLSRFPALTRLEIPAECVEAASAELMDAGYTLVVYGEAGK